ncbi:element excision factor XisH family protein [Anabaena sp. 90]|uniref:element excision factor XisH family protein n=1 Tax=Anabaena sp. 90 TaxID=46234 RepID=UPI0009FC8396
MLRILYLAVPITVYNEFFIMPFIQSVIKKNQLCLVVDNIEQEVISELSESGYPGFKDLQDVYLSCVLRA